ncbi:hypothetical protein MAQ5080_03103 [Marinomonas aquimarina]|uniref:Uncharacterized protein n=1 Tax=Marinomonas aquimarina TaxID=295068 RepID=A0A1A8TQ26_9GAMM|nr:hypothetical protein MAQ5080_03103 [Marinomonas aquimarina]
MLNYMFTYAPHFDLAVAFLEIKEGRFLLGKT